MKTKPSKDSAKLSDLDNTTKIIVLFVISILVYLVAYIITRNIVYSAFGISTSTTTMMGRGGGMGGAGSYYNTLITSISLLAAAISALVTNLYLKINLGHSQPMQKEIHLPAKNSGKKEIEILKKALSADEKKLVEEVQKAKEITQDSLRFRLNWSKAKVSTILTNLDRMGIIQRKREGKTYTVTLQK